MAIVVQMPKFKCVAIGGTFDRLHDGHKALLRESFRVGQKVIIGVSTKKLLKGKERRELIQPYNRRVSDLKNFLASQGYIERARLVPLSDRFGITTSDPTIEAIVVSEETAPVVEEINSARRKRGLNPLSSVVIRMVLDKSGKPIRSTDLRELEARRKRSIR